jgi:hypothetical protein
MVRLRFSEILVKFAILVAALIIISVTVAADFIQYPDKPMEKSGSSGNWNDGRYINYLKSGNAISGANRCVNGYCGPETGHAIYGENKKMDKQQSSERVVNFVKRRTFCIPKIERRIEKVK